MPGEDSLSCQHNTYLEMIIEREGERERERWGGGEGEGK